MSAPKFTPGPWKVNGKDVFTELGAPNADGLCAEENDGWQIADCGAGLCFVGGLEHELSLAEQKANAHLIAAAPGLYAALAAAIEGEGEHAAGCKEYAPGYDDSHCCWVHVARAALAKAAP